MKHDLFLMLIGACLNSVSRKSIDFPTMRKYLEMQHNFVTGLCRKIHFEILIL